MNELEIIKAAAVRKALLDFAKAKICEAKCELDHAFSNINDFHEKMRLVKAHIEEAEQTINEYLA